MGVLRPADDAHSGRRWLASLPLILAAAVFSLAAAPALDSEQAVRLRFEWTGDKPEVWAGILETSQGTIVRPVSLGMEADDAGTLWPDGKSLWLERHSPRTRDGFEATIVAPLSAKLSLTVQVANPGGQR